MPKYRVVLQRFPYGSVEHTPCVNWLLGFATEVTKDKRFDIVIPPPLDDTPITMTRNRSVEIAKKLEADFLLMIDSDMAPDCEAGDPQAKPFWPTTIDFMLNHHGPCAVAAPYCGPPPLENVYVFNWQNMETDKADDAVGMKLGQFGREHAATLGGIQEVAALATGLIVFDMRGFQRIKPPYFSYEWEDEGPACSGCGVPKPGLQAAKCSTEDVVTTRDLSLGGVPQYCNWDAWAGHRKIKTVRKPRPFTVDGVAAKMQEAVATRRVGGEQLIEIRSERFAREIAEVEARGKPDADATKELIGSGATDRIVVAVGHALSWSPEQYADLFNGELPKPLTAADLLG